jgi:hypothetical protein
MHQSYLNTPGNKNLSKHFQGNSLTDIVPLCNNTTFGCCENNSPKLTFGGNNCSENPEEAFWIYGQRGDGPYWHPGGPFWRRRWGARRWW